MAKQLGEETVALADVSIMEKPEIEVRPNQGPSFIVVFETESLTVGRSRHCEVVLVDSYLSRHHLVLYKERGRVFVRDTSRNGTYLNGDRLLSPRELGAGDVVEFNKNELTLLSDEGLSSANTIWHDTSEPEAPSSETAGLRDPEDLEWHAERLRVVNEIHNVLSRRHVTEEDLLDLVLESACKQLGTEFGDVFLESPKGGYRRAASRCPSGKEAIPHSRTLLQGVCELGKVAYVPDALADSLYGDADSIVSTGLRSLIAVPLPGERGALGMLVLGSPLPNRFDNEDQNLLSTLASVAALKIGNTRLVEQAAKKQKELALAREVQESLIPSKLPEVPGFELWADNLPSLEISGDYYNVFGGQTRSEWVLLVADISGKGMPAALLAASLDAMAEAQIELDRDPATICSQISKRLLVRTQPARFATAFMAVLDVETRSVRYCNAGHVPGIFVRQRGGVDELRQTGPPLGLIEHLPFAAADSAFEEGDLLVLVSDGLTEAESPEGEEFGLGRLEDLLLEQRSLALEELAEVVHVSIADFTGGALPHDDRTILLARCRSTAS